MTSEISRELPGGLLQGVGRACSIPLATAGTTWRRCCLPGRSLETQSVPKPFVGNGLSVPPAYCYCYITSVVSDSVQPHRWQPTRLPRPWDSPGKNTGVGCHFLLQCMKVKSQSEVAQSYLTLSDPMDCSLPGSSVHRIFQARVLEWGAIAPCLLPTKILAPGRRAGVGIDSLGTLHH